MKKTLLLAFTIVACGVLVGAMWATFGTKASEARPLPAGVVTAADAAAHVGETVTVEGIVSEVHVSERATFIDLGGRYPNEEFTGVIFTSDAGAFSNVDAYEGKTLDITGTVQLYRGRPEIILTSPSQIRIE
jgi:DNA/RNA endonuclease YhcR with UshA esterase domain